MSFGDRGGALALPSPTHPKHIDVQNAVRTLTRSLSRSPSKLCLQRQASQGSDLSNSASAKSSARNTPSPSLRHMASQHLLSHTPSQNPSNLAQHQQTTPLSAPQPQDTSQTPVATPLRPSKLSLRPARTSSRLAGFQTTGASGAFKSTSRNRPSPTSPSKPALGVVSDSSQNSAPCSNEQDALDRDNRASLRSRSPVQQRSFEKTKGRYNVQQQLDMSGMPVPPTTRLSAVRPRSNSKASPMKRGDVTMSMDQTIFGSPKAKRRSHGPANFPSTAGSGLGIFETDPTSPTTEDNGREYGWTSSESVAPAETPTVPRRASAQLRRMPNRASWGRRHAAVQLSQLTNEASTPAAKNRPRLSLDHYLPPPQRDSPFGPGPLPNPSVHQIQQAHQPHPLSRTMTTSSSNSSIQDESPSHLPQISERPRLPMNMNWSKSLPMGAVRPVDRRSIGSVSTPDYKSAKPFLGAFASTGLVSKMNRNPENAPLGRPGAPVPDTPCKKPFSGYATYPPLPLSIVKARGQHIKHTFGTPLAPFGDMGENKSEYPGSFGNQSGRPSISMFTAKHRRSGSHVSTYSDEARSPLDVNGDTLMMNADYGDGDDPPTPTKHHSVANRTNSLSHVSTESPSLNRYKAASLSAIERNWPQDQAGVNRKYRSPLGSHHDGSGGGDAPSWEHSTSPSVSLPSFRQFRAKLGSLSIPASLDTSSKTASEDRKASSKVSFAKTLTVEAASPLEKIKLPETTSPQTPQESQNGPPLDAIGLSIAHQTEGFLFPPTSIGNKTRLSPATPTTRHDGMPFAGRRAVTPTNNTSRDVDAALLKRFAKVEYLGEGEFSQVYKVVEVSKQTQPTRSAFFSTPTHHTPPSPATDKIFAVKKLVPFKGVMDRSLRTREIAALRALRGCNHVVEYIDSWEERGSMYIRTEFCEEGSLETFLAVVGVKGRLDDFRIWKILLEIGQGLQSVHDAGFVHLDLKPANILITFEGVLKIGDFGMAASLPVDKGPDFEGDREYLAPEVLRGEIDKPADIFSLGLIMLEIAANVKLPDNGATWTALREGDFREVPVLTQDADAVLRDATGMPVEESESSSGKFARRGFPFRGGRRCSGDIFGLARKSELHTPPDFMKNAHDANSLDTVVKWMLSAETVYRPSISQLLELHALHWVMCRQRAGATVFEGNWGPSMEPMEPITLDSDKTARPVSDDIEMTDV